MDVHHIALVPARAALGATMLYHGSDKLRGQGPEQTAQFFRQIGLEPAPLLAKLTGWTELLAGAATVLGFATRASALAVLVTQGMAIAKVHRPKGFSNLAGGYEFNLLIMAVAAGMLLAGPGEVSAHGAVARRGEHRWRLFAPRRSLSERLLLALG
jgi:putative oxidoreductase